ncbi:MAG: outer membrane beta-barrel protein [Azoarcus sp.]|nr:outer membrane beta-barrel protein [Azoarcus sp.]
MADEADALNFTVSQAAYYESNLYKLADGAQAPGGKRHDRIAITGLGAAFDRVYSRQRLRAALDVKHASYAIHDYLDYTAPDARLAWDWQVGNHFSGLLSHDYRESLAGFEDVVGVQQTILLYSRTGASANYWWHPNWAAGLGVSSARSRYKDDARPTSELDARDLDFNLTYRPASGNTVVLTLRQTDGRYPGRPAVAGSIRDYQQRDYRLRGEWRLTGATVISGYLGHTGRSYDLAPNRDFSGVTGRLALQWVPTAKTSINVSWRRELGADQDLFNNYAVTNAITLAPNWAITEKIRLGATLEYSKRDYGGDPELGFDGTDSTGEDRTRRYGLNLQYQPMRTLQLIAGVQKVRRTSVLAAREYEAETAWITGRFAF